MIEVGSRRGSQLTSELEIVQRSVGGISSSMPLCLGLCSRELAISLGRKRPLACRGGAAFRSLLGIGLSISEVFLAIVFRHEDDGDILSSVAIIFVNREILAIATI